MQIISLKTLLRMPDGTIFQKYIPCIVDNDLMRFKGGIEGSIDFQYDLIGYSGVDNFDDSYAEVDSGKSIKTVPNMTLRDGLNDPNQLFVVWEKKDLENAMTGFQDALDVLKEKKPENNVSSLSDWTEYIRCIAISPDDKIKLSSMLVINHDGFQPIDRCLFNINYGIISQFVFKYFRGKDFIQEDTNIFLRSVDDCSISYIKSVGILTLKLPVNVVKNDNSKSHRAVLDLTITNWGIT